MKRIFGLTLCLLATSMAQAEQKLQVIELDSDEPVSAEAAERGKVFGAAQERAGKVPAKEAKTFMTELSNSVATAMSQLQNNQIDKTKARDQIIELRKLKKDGERFGYLNTPFHTCNEASIHAYSSWEGLINNNYDQFKNSYVKYLQAGAKCEEATN